MKSFPFAIALATLLAVAGCTVAPPKPINANGTVNASVTVGDLDLAYQDAVRDATVYVTTCHAAPTTPGCSAAVIAGLKAASPKANKALHAAHDALKVPPGIGSGIDKAIADLQAALVFLRSYTAQIPSSILKGGAL